MYKCKTCHFQTESLSEMQQHVKNQHQSINSGFDDDSLTCSQFNTIGTDSVATSYARDHSQDSGSYSDCGGSFDGGGSSDDY